MTPEQIAALGVDTPMPTSLGDSIDALQKAIDEKKLLPLGEEFLSGFLAHKRAEDEVFSKMPELERRQLFTTIW
jgi:glutamine synthetase